MNDYYVYAHIRPDKNEIFYIGKGRGRRAIVSYKRNKIWNDIVSKNNGLFEVIYLHKNLSESEAFNLEMKYIIEKGRLCNNSGCLANLTLGGEGSSGHIFSYEHRKKISIACLGKNHPLYGKKHTVEHINNISNSLKGKVPWNKGIKHSNETKEKIKLKAIGRSAPNKGKKMSNEQKKKLSNYRKGRATKQSKLVKNYITNIIVAESAVQLYNSIDCRGRSLVTIQAYLNGNTKKPDWFTYEYV